MNLHLELGERGLIIGQTGSGKTAGATTMIERSPIYPKVILDTKGEPKFDRFLGGKNILVESVKEFSRLKPKSMPDYTVVRPDIDELADPAVMDYYPGRIYAQGKPVFLYLDEVYQFHNGGRAGSGLLGVLTRGRSKGITTLMGAQRPSWVSRFCLTEAQKMYIYRILDKRDRKTIGEIIPGFEKLTPAEMYHFYHYNAGDDAPSYYKPFDYKELPVDEAIRLKSEGWI